MTEIREIEAQHAAAVKLEAQRDLIVEACARACHEANAAYGAALGDLSQATWEQAPDWQKKSAREGVAVVLAGGSTPEALHEQWCRHKLAEGWKHGAEKNAELKTHPCLVPYTHLPFEQRQKDHLFQATALIMASCLRAVYGAQAQVKKR